MSKSPWFHTHVHSEFSTLDAISSVNSLVEKAHQMKQPAFSLTDHGTGAGWVQAYKAGKQFGMPVFLGWEGYLTVDPIVEPKKGDLTLERFHIGMLALNLDGYKELVKLMSLSHTRPRFNRFPRFDLNDFAEFSTENIAITTGCFFGLVQQTLVKQGIKQAKRIVEMYARLYPNTFVEIQNHNIDHSEQESGIWISNDADICKALVQIATQVGLPVVASQDSHYRSSKEKPAHELMKRMVYRGKDEQANEFPGDSFHLASTDWVKEHHKKKHWKLAEEGCETLLDLYDLEIPPLAKYKPRIPTLKKDPQRWLEKKAWAGLDALEKLGLLKKNKKQYVKRMKHELDIVKFLGHAGYFTLVHLVVDFCNREKIYVEARGSANGSLICYALGITSVDPLEWGLLFERFLSRDRKKPPDVDLDIEDIRRPDVLAFLDKQFGAQQIGTYQQLGARDNDDKGSILVTYNSYLRAKLGNDKFIPRYGKGIETIREVERVSEADYKGLREMSKLKVKRAYGVHPAGMLLSTKQQKIETFVPSMLVASSNTRVTQFSGEDVEELGYTKMDILGQRTLTTMRRTQELIGREDPLDFKWIPANDKVTCKFLSQGRTDTGVFQFEGYSMALGARSLKIRNTYDCVLAGALFRPACIDSGVTQAYIDRRFDSELRKNIDYPHPAFEEVLKPTNGLVLFQEQVLEIMRRLGLDYEGINTFFKIVKDSGKGATARNLERIKEVEAHWADICERNGIDDPDWAWEYIEGYTKYGFNKAHSAGYGVRSYRVAYLKVHYPLEFHTALLESWAGKPKESIYIREARRLDIRLLSADVNISGANWTLDPKRQAIRRGLESIKGIGHTAAVEIEKNQPYEDIDELIELNSARTVSGAPKYLKDGEWTGNLMKLREAGALSSLGFGRGIE
jgi:DNA polymerase-3 subunit alpha